MSFINDKNDCFGAMPPGVDWIPVEAAKKRLMERLTPIDAHETITLDKAEGRILAHDVFAPRAHPNYDNSAVDGYGIAYSENLIEFTLLKGCASAGSPFEGVVKLGDAVQILTGGKLPQGVEAIALQEICTVKNNKLSLKTPLKKGANIRYKGEDIQENQCLFKKGHRLTYRDIALLIATSLHDVTVYKKLKIAVLSTGSELAQSNDAFVPSHFVYDVNRPLLLNLIQKWGMEALDYGAIQDDPILIKNALEEVANKADAILISGGASAGDEDHVSKILGTHATRHTWRIALKPGRPLSLATWGKTPVFGLPGNTIAAYVCALVFARPALFKMANRTSAPLHPLLLPANFEKAKKPGRTEYLRAKIKDNCVITQNSEGSGRTSGLSWSNGLIELPHDSKGVKKGDIVSYIPYSEFEG